MKSKKLTSLLNIQIGTKSEIEGLETCGDTVLASLMVMSVNTAALLPLIKTQFSGSKSEATNKKITSIVATVIGHLLVIANQYHFDIPDDEELEDRGQDIPVELTMDSILLVMNTLGEISELTNIIFLDGVDKESAWADPEPPEDLQESICKIIIQLRILCERQGIDMEDVFFEVE